jgi:hypothetical protein
MMILFRVVTPYRVDSYVDISISEKHTVFILRDYRH